MGRKRASLDWGENSKGHFVRRGSDYIAVGEDAQNLIDSAAKAWYNNGQPFVLCLEIAIKNWRKRK